MEFAVNERIAELRKTLKLSQNDFAKRVDLTSPAISRIENKEVKPQQKTISAIARAFNVSMSWLVDGTGEMLLPGESFNQSSRSDNWKDEAFQLQNKYIENLERQVKFLESLVQKVMPNFPNGVDLALGFFPVNTVSAVA